MRRLLAFTGATLGLLLASVAASPADSGDAGALLARIGQRLEQYFARAQSIVCRETVQIQTLGHDLTWDGSHVRKLLYELRVAWAPSSADGGLPEATVLRELLSIDGRAPALSKNPDCLDPKPVSPEPLTLLLPSRRAENVFTWAGAKRTSAGSTIMLDYRAVKRGSPTAMFHGNCASVELPGWERGRLWVDAETAAVVRIDEHLTGPVDVPIPKSMSREWDSLASFRIERADSSIRYNAVTFHDPEETLMLPQSVELLQTGHNRLRITHTFTDYRRFVTGGRIVATPELQ